MMVLRRRREVVCQQWVELVTDYLEGALPRRLTKAIDRHLAGCVDCTEYLQQMRATIRIAGNIRDVPSDVPTHVLDALEAAFRDYRGDGAGGR